MQNLVVQCLVALSVSAVVLGKTSLSNVTVPDDDSFVS